LVSDVDKGIAFGIGANLAFGTHFQRLGFTLSFMSINNHFQANTEIRVYYSFKNLGPKTMYPELVLSQGLLYAFGDERKWNNPFFSSVSNQTIWNTAVAYSYNAYFNKRKTTQQTGIIAIHCEDFSLITENDILARPMLDRFRTAAFLVQYQYQDKMQLALNCSMWTGQFKRRTQSENAHFSRGCYMDTTGGTYTNYSHGLLSLQAKYFIPDYYGNVQANVGIDAEQVRNAVQNKFIHDMPLVPEKWKKGKNCHIPMLDESGNQYLYNDGQQIRKPCPYLNLFSNAGVFY
jgi:hypothetical protein